MAFLGAVPNWFFKSQIFFPSEKIKITDRSLIIRFSQNGIDHDSNAAAKDQRIGGIPSGGCHGPDDLFLGTDQGDIQGISGDIARGLCHPRALLDNRKMRLMTLPETWKNQVSDEKIEGGDSDENSSPRVGKPHRVCDSGSVTMWLKQTTGRSKSLLIEGTTKVQ